MDSLDRFRWISAVERSPYPLTSRNRLNLPAWLICRQTLWTFQDHGTRVWIFECLRSLKRRGRAVAALLRARRVEREFRRMLPAPLESAFRIAFVGRSSHKMKAHPGSARPLFDRTLECAKQGAADAFGDEAILVLGFGASGGQGSSWRSWSPRDLPGALRDYRDVKRSIRPVRAAMAAEARASRSGRPYVDPVVSLCIHNAASMILSRARWKLFFARERGVSHLFVAAWYFPDAMGLIAAAHEMRRKVIDVQHGQQGAIHGMYCGWNALPAYSHALPDYFWVWNQYTSDNIRRSSDAAIGERLIVGGRCLPPATFAARSRPARSSGAPSGRGRTVLVALQPENHDSDVPIPREALEYLDRLGPSRIIVKPHPAMRVETLDAAVNVLSKLPCTLDVREPLEPLVAAMSSASLHMTSHSSSVFDAIRARVPTVLWGRLASEQFRGVIDAGCAWLIGEAPTDWDSIIAGWPLGGTAYFEPTDLRATRDSALNRILFDRTPGESES